MKGLRGFQNAELNPKYEGGKVGYWGVHSWARSHLPIIRRCVDCGSLKNVDAANISGLYVRHISDWKWQCRKCHMKEDGRSERLRQSGKSRKLPDQICKNCGITFHTDKKQLFHVNTCYFEYKKKHKEEYYK